MCTDDDCSVLRQHFHARNGINKERQFCCRFSLKISTLILDGCSANWQLLGAFLYPPFLHVSGGVPQQALLTPAVAGGRQALVPQPCDSIREPVSFSAMTC